MSMEGYKRKTDSANETFELAERFANHLKKGDVLGLSGPLGAGKTEFVKGLAEGLGMEQARTSVTSPTYTLQNIYDLDVSLIHCDAYRLEDSEQFRSLGWHEQFQQGITAIEWVDRFLPEIRSFLSFSIRIEYGEASSSRIIQITPERAASEDRLPTL